MTTIFGFVRHGQTDWNLEGRIQGIINNPLNEEGRKQAHQLGSFLKEQGEDWNLILTSPLIRAQETARIIQSYFPKLSLIIEPAFIEREFGQAEGQLITKDLFDRICLGEIIAMEDASSLQMRVETAVKRIALIHPGKRILVVAHSHVIKGLLTKIDGGFTFRHRMDNGSITYFRVENDDIMLEALNQNHHLIKRD
ncbi:MAG: histidine phosphatase family protein [Bacilli bacterium]|nr:histidine phosphatase family protein [Bacilli bacterium]